ncbi:ABC transporter ATP-binding protein [Arthrobacter bambusae]|uniref:ABC transporter ATP-binding protein n=1 Tax=Arthrobacter bambusae TaxID=1338426 RepID=UPI0027810FFF|nr:ATP-binding cassette domain-containing protein [Arthrobacter bambusae]MDQ0032200.1 daunorubicin resistance ABC transporter ATP-binding subunit [Arthrobacter bambusae]MDQ0100321.1 daunorubicin resistance ABC transporter ATP-binding subunit [Arthrobacter bambusae]
MTETAIELAGLTKRFGSFTAVDGLSLRVERGEIFGLLGPNGSGKTTTIDMISGLSRPTSGAITVLGIDVLADPRKLRRSLGTVPQENALYEELTAEANLRFHADLFDVPRAGLNEKITALLELAQLQERRKSRVSTFSGGMKRRLALVRAMLHEPELLYFDEPTLGVDVQSRHALWDRIRELKERGTTVLITSNYLEEANALCDRLAIIDRGKLVALDSPSNLRRSFGDTVLEMRTHPAPGDDVVRKVRALPGVVSVIASDGSLKVTVEGGADVTGKVVTEVVGTTSLEEIQSREPSLDEVFLSLTGKELRE